MAENQDARPFVDLKKDAEEFRQKFDEDIQKCMSYLDAKLTALICEPETLGSPSKKNAFKTNPLVEFSKAKYEIFISVKSMINEMEREWLKYVTEMKKLFIENVEILLAGTKLEVKLPISDYSGFKKSPLKERTSIAGSIYPIINTFAKNVAALGSPLRNINDSADSAKGSKERAKVTQLNQLKRDSAKVVLRKLVEKATTSSPKKYVEQDSSSSEDDSGNISRQSTRNSNDKSLKSSFGNSTNRGKSKSTARISRKKSKHSSSDPETSQETSRNGTKEKDKSSNSSSPNSSYQNSETTRTIDKSELSSSSDHKILHGSSKNRNTASIDAKSDSSTGGKEVSSSKRKGRKQSIQTKQTSEIVPEKITESEDESSQSTELTIVKSVRATRSGRTPAKSMKSNTHKKSATSEESGTESNFLQSVSSGKKKKAHTRQKLDISSVTVKNKKDTEVSSKVISNEEPDSPQISLQSSSPKKSNLLSTNVTPAAGLSRSKKVTFTSNYQTIDDIAVLMSDTRPATSRRRKTLVSNLDGVITDIDITPRNSRSVAKRKTICGISNVTSAPSPKGLKVGGDKKYASLALESNTDDNLLESDGNYSDWMSLKTIDGRIPTKPGIYEVKVWRAKKPAYIGHCESLRQMLTLHKLKHNSGHKHLDKFIDRNMDDIQIRFEVISSIDNAKDEVKNRLKCFVARYHTTPAYN